MDTENKIKITVRIFKDPMRFDNVISIYVIQRNEKLNMSFALVQSLNVQGYVSRQSLPDNNPQQVQPLLTIPFDVAKAIADAVIAYEQHQQYPATTHESYPGATNSFSNKTISAFAYNTGRKIEELITKETNNLKQTNQTLSHKILQWYQNTKDEEFAKHFGIEIIHPGKTI